MTFKVVTLVGSLNFNYCVDVIWFCNIHLQHQTILSDPLEVDNSCIVSHLKLQQTLLYLLREADQQRSETGLIGIF